MEQNMFIRILNSEMELATGCTEPGAVALTAAEAGQALRKAGVDKAEEITVNASINIIKNAMSAGIPGTDYEGMDYAAAIGALGGDPVYLLEVMNHVPRETVEAAAALVKAGKVRVNVAQVPQKLYIEVIAKGGGHTGRAIVRDLHTNVVLVEQDGVATLDKRDTDTAAAGDSDVVSPEQIASFLTVRSIWDYCTKELDPMNDPIDTEVAGLRTLPDVVFELNIPQIMSVMSALVLSVLVGLAATWTNSKLTCDFLGEFQNIVLDIVGKIIIPMLPFYIAATFCNLSYEGMITHQLPAFIQIILIVMAGHYIWLAVLYLLAGAYSGKNPWEVLRHYGPAYLTAVGTMSSAATLAVALDCARKSKVLRKDMVSFGIPLFANIHLCGSVLTEVFFCMTISKILYGHLPSIGTMLLFCALLGIFAIGAPGVPGGTVMASLGLITGVLMFDDAGTALMLAIFALQDSFGTACNVTGDGALTLMLTGYAEKHGIADTGDLESPIL